MKNILVSIVAILVSIASCSTVPSTDGGGFSLFRFPGSGMETRWATAENPFGEKGNGGLANADRKGKPARFQLKAGQSHILAKVTGTSGIVRRIWVTLSDRSPQMMRGIKIEMFWDESEKPAVSAPLGDFFCQSLGQIVAFESALFSSPEARSFNCYVPMPFRTGMRIVIANDSDADLDSFWYEVDYTLSDRLGDDVLYFHAYYNRENPTALFKDFEILPPVTGRGRYLGATIGVIANQNLYLKTWWGEGEVKIYLDGDWLHPTLCGTGTEDYIGDGWGQGVYGNLYQGCPYLNYSTMRYSFYRLHIPDPVYFNRDIRVTIQQIGCCLDEEARKKLKELGNPIYLTGPGHNQADLSKMDANYLFERQDDWSSCAYFYLDRPTNDLPPIDPYMKRIEGL